MRNLIRRTAWAVIAVALAACVVQTSVQSPPTASEANPEALVLLDFQRRIDDYVELRGQLARDAPSLKETDDPARIREAQVSLAAKIRAARKEARAGDIFTPEIRQRLRRLMSPELEGAAGRETKAEIREDAPTGGPLKVNATYPEAAGLSTVPPNVLATLPRLPDDLEYRVVGKHLILRDVDANLIVDFVPDAIP